MHTTKTIRKIRFSILHEVDEIVRITQQLVTLITSVTINKRNMSIEIHQTTMN